MGQEIGSWVTMPSMGTVHDLIEVRGKAGTLAFDFDRPVVEAAAAYMADEDAGIGFLYSGWCQAALPHRKLANDKGWQIDGERIRLIVEPGMRGGAHGEPEPVGVPYGSRARLILLRLQSEALRTQSRDVELGSVRISVCEACSVSPTIGQETVSDG